MAMLAPSFLPSTAVVELTYRCNHQCFFCSCPWERKNGNFKRLPELSTTQWRDVIAKLCAMGVCNFSFSGGEALLRDDVFDLLQFAGRQQCQHIETVDDELQSRMAPPNLYLLSNGALVDQSVLRFCLENKVQLSMSLPGLRTFKQHTGVDNADHVLQQFAEAKAMGLKTVVNITVTKLNLPELHENIAAAFLAGADQLLMNRFLPGGRGLGHAELCLSIAEIKTMLDTAEDVLDKAGRFGSLGTELPKCVVDPTAYKRITVGTRCSAAIQFFVIGPEGYVRACNHSEVRLNHVDQIEELKLNEYWTRFTQKRYLPEACADCGLAYDCDGGCREAAHIAHGDLAYHDALFPADARRLPLDQS
ncbi:MAG: radical SAM protein [Candidatus Sumerlaeota bacterium]|nr:radical SAM protein [Candidatus Sumerlaeota bacterium]